MTWPMMPRLALPALLLASCAGVAARDPVDSAPDAGEWADAGSWARADVPGLVPAHDRVAAARLAPGNPEVHLGHRADVLLFVPGMNRCAIFDGAAYQRTGNVSVQFKPSGPGDYVVEAAPVCAGDGGCTEGRAWATLLAPNGERIGGTGLMRLRSVATGMQDETAGTLDVVFPGTPPMRFVAEFSAPVCGME